MQKQFEFSGGSVIGRCHRLAGKNNQDACYWCARSNSAVAVVCDGCGSGLRSEVGAQLGARLVAETILRQTNRWSIDAPRCRGHSGHEAGMEYREATAPCDSQFWEDVRQEILTQLLATARGLGGSLAAIVGEYFLFTVVGALLTPDESYFFSIGDGVLIVNGEELRLGPFPGNAPPYLAYGLLDIAAAEPELSAPRFQLHRTLPTLELRSFLLGTDGVVDLIDAALRPLPGRSALCGSISQFWSEDRYFKNPDAVRRRLATAGRDAVPTKENGLLPDDTTLIVGRARPGGECDEK